MAYEDSEVDGEEQVLRYASHAHLDVLFPPCVERILALAIFSALPLLKECMQEGVLSEASSDWGR